MPFLGIMSLKMLLNVIKKSLKFVPKHRTYRVVNMHTTTADTNLVVTEKVGRVFMIAINRPEKRNCVNHATALQLCEAFEQFEQDEESYVAVLYGKGGNFCAGYDLSELSLMDGKQQSGGGGNFSAGLDLAELASKENKGEMPLYQDLNKGRGPMGPSRRMIEKPIIAAVEGYAVAGGLELSLLCDMRIVEEATIMGVLCRRFGVPLIDGGTVRLPHLIGLSRAMDLILTGRPVTGKEAFQMGLANKVVPTGAALGEAMNIARALCKHPQECMRRDRLSAYYSCFGASSMKDAFDFEFNNAKHVLHQESVKGAKKFVSGLGRKGNFDIGDNSKL